MDITYLNDLDPMDFYEAILELADGVPIPEIQIEDNKLPSLIRVPCPYKLLQ